MRAVQALGELRAQTMIRPNAPNAGLLPAGFNDGGIVEITAEYSSVYWAITGLRSAGRLARDLGQGIDAVAFDQPETAFRTAFERARQRDMRTTPAGHRYLPVRVGFQGADEIPQLAQWAVLEAHLFSDWATPRWRTAHGNTGAAG